MPFSYVSKLPYPQINKHFTFLFFFVPAVLGSAVSFCFIGGAIWCVFEIASRRRYFSLDKPARALAAACYAFCAANLISSAVNGALLIDAHKLVYITTFALFPFSYSIWSISDKVALRRASLYGSMTACYAGLAIGAIQYFVFGMRAEGGAGNAIIFATVVCLATLLCLAATLSGDEKNKFPLICATLAGTLAGTLAIILSGSRTVWVALPIGALIVTLVYRRKVKESISTLTIGLGILACFIIVAVGFPIVYGRVSALFSDWTALDLAGRNNTSLGLRVSLWDIGLKAFQEKPLFGHGIMGSRALIAAEMRQRFGVPYNFTHFHDGFLTALVQTGLFGALALAAIFFVAVRNACIVLCNNPSSTERYGCTMILIVVSTYLTCSTTGILVGHDILDSVLMIFLILGTYLATGTSLSSQVPPFAWLSFRSRQKSVSSQT